MRVISDIECKYVAGAFEPNGCTAVPNALFGYNFKPACDTHDINYSSDTIYSKAQADQVFLNDMLNICRDQYNDAFLCQITAEIYYIGVTLFGGSYYDGPASGSGGFGFYFYW